MPEVRWAVDMTAGRVCSGLGVGVCQVQVAGAVECILTAATRVAVCSDLTLSWGVVNSTLPTSRARANVGGVEFTMRTIAARVGPVFRDAK